MNGIPLEAVLVASQAAVQEARFAGHDKYRIAVLCEAKPQSLAEIAALTKAEEADEALLMGLRLTEGISLGKLAALAGLAPHPEQVERLIGLGLLSRPASNRIAATLHAI